MGNTYHIIIHESYTFAFVHSISGLTSNGHNQILFGNLIRSDGFVVEFVFYKRNQVDSGSDLGNFDLALDDFTYAEVAHNYHPIFVDPGRKSLFSTVSGLDMAQHPVLRCSTKEHYHLTGSTNFSIEQAEGTKGD